MCPKRVPLRLATSAFVWRTSGILSVPPTSLVSHCTFFIDGGETLMMFVFFFYRFVISLVFALSMTSVIVSNGMLWTFAVCSVLLLGRLSLVGPHVYPSGWWTDMIVMQCAYVLFVISGSVYRREQWCIRETPGL